MVTTPSLPILAITSEMRPPIAGSFAERVATSPIFWSSLMSSRCASSASITFSVPRLSSSASWMTLKPFVEIASSPASMIAWLSTTEVVVPSPTTSLVRSAACLMNSAPRFSYGSESSISLATVTPSKVTIGAP